MRLLDILRMLFVALLVLVGMAIQAWGGWANMLIDVDDSYKHHIALEGSDAATKLEAARVACHGTLIHEIDKVDGIVVYFTTYCKRSKK